MSFRFLSCLVFALGLAPAAAVFAQAGTGNLYSVTSRVEIVGMPFQMPPQTAEVCGPKDQSSQQMIPHDKNCTVSDFRVVGNKSTFTMTCTGANPMTATGEFERLSAEAYRGTMRMQGNMEGEPMDMTMTFDGRRLRDCNYATESPAAQGREMLARSCAEQLSAPGYPYMLHTSFLGANAMCAADKAKFCARITPLANDLPALRQAAETAEQMRTAAGGGTIGLWESFQGCGLPRATVMTRACAKAESAPDYDFLGAMCPDVVARLCPTADPKAMPDFVARYCPVQAQAYAAQNCVARGFTIDASSPNGKFCNAWAAQRLRNGQDAGDGNTAPGAQPTSATPPAAPKKGWRDRVRDAIGG